MQEHFFTYRNSMIRYLRAGSGQRLLLCFHGYGETADIYSFIPEYAGNQYAVVAIDLPFHGETRWEDGLLVTEADLVSIVGGILGWNENTGESEYREIILVGFSLGGRVALSLYMARPEWFSKMVLLAPDGLKVNGWYWLATQTVIGNRFFRFTMKHPGWFFGFLKFMNWLRLVNARIFKFVNYYIGNQEVRDLLYARWTSLRRLRPDLPRIRSLVKTRHTPVRLVYGLHDRIIRPGAGEKFRIGIEAECRIEIIPSGHQVLHEKHAEEIIRAIKG